MNTQKHNPSAADFLPKIKKISTLREAAKHCQGCELYKYATQTVFGEGSNKAKLIIVGEIAGKKEDEYGKPFVGPSGKLLRTSLESTGIDFNKIYFTNVVKHFKFTYMNKKKLHRSPSTREIKACMPWLEEEIDVIKPEAILCLGSVAAKSLIDKNFHIHERRGHWYSFRDGIKIIATFHPSAILRARDQESRHEMRAIFRQDLLKIALKLKC